MSAAAVSHHEGAVVDATYSTGAPLATGMRQRLEPLLGADLSACTPDQRLREPPGR
jgi:hypothetical protein